jgi:hypothetical protein
MHRFIISYALFFFISFFYSSVSIADYNLKCSSTNFSSAGEVSYNHIYADITEQKDQVNFNGTIFKTSFDETFYLIAKQLNQRVVLDKLEGVIFLEELINKKFIVLEIFYCIGLQQEKI